MQFISCLGKEVPYITEEKLLKILETCKQESSYSLLIRTLGEVYSSADSLSQSFLIHAGSPIDAMLDKAPKDLKNLKKEDVRTMEGDLDKDEDSQEVNQEEGECSERSRSRKSTSPSDDLRVDIPSLRRAYKALFEVPGSVFESALVYALRTLSGNLELDLRLFGRGAKNDNAEDVLNVFVIVLEIPALGSSEYLEMALPLVCKAASHLPLRLQARLAQIWARHCRTRLKGMLEALQQLITLKVISGQFSRDYCVQDEETITTPTKLMKVWHSLSEDNLKLGTYILVGDLRNFKTVSSCCPPC